MSLSELLAEAFAAMRRNKLRSFLTLLGIVIGVATLVGVVSVIVGLNTYVREKLFNLAPDVYIVTKFGIIRGHEEFLEALKRPDISQDDFDRLRSVLTRADKIGVSVETRSPVTYGAQRLGNARIGGTSATFGDLVRLDLSAGRFFLEAEARGSKQVAVIGWDVKEQLFPHVDPIGRTISVSGLPFRVIGLIAQQGKALGQSRDNYVYIPIDTYRQMFGSRDTLDIFIKASGGVAGVDASADEARAVLRALRHTDFRASDPFGIITAEALQDIWKQVSAAAFLLTTLIASVSLGVGGIVITNIMLVAVAERTQEIGLRRALGARQADVRRQFLLEAALLALVGGVIGVAGGGLISLAVDRLAHFPAELTPTIVAAGLALSVVVGVTAGYWPAVSASRLEVVDALRAE